MRNVKPRYLLLVGLTTFVLVAFTVYAVLPFDFCLNWGSVVVEFLKGAAPVIAALIGIICIFIGIADIKDKKEARREELEASKKEE